MNLVELIEAFDSKIDLDWKPGAGGSSMAGFMIDGVRYVLQLLPITVNYRKIYEASFHLADEKGDSSFKTTGASSSPSSVYGVVANGLIDRLRDGEYSSAFFSAERRHSSSDHQHEAKLRIYGFAAKRIARKLGWEMYCAPDEFLLLDEYAGPNFGRFKHWQEEVREAVGDGPFPTLKRTQ